MTELLQLLSALGDLAQLVTAVGVLYLARIVQGPGGHAERIAGLEAKHEHG